MRIGIECGGTFTDYVALDGAGALITAGKVFSTPGDPSIAVLSALEQFPAEHLRGAELVHGSTVATNSLIERKGARVALIVTRGFRDLVFLQRQDRETMYNLRYVAPVPLVSREDIFEVTERVNAAGEVLLPVDPSEMTRLAAELATRGYEAVAVSLLHSYANASHEEKVAAAITAVTPEIQVSLSSTCSREFREYERTTTTTVDAFLKPRIRGYLGSLAERAADLGVEKVQVMQSNGGMVSAAVAGSLPLTMLRSGPAAGVAAAVQVAAQAGVKNIVTMDMGGTSTDVAVVRDGQIELTPETVADGLPVRVPMVDIIAVGAGGGSLVGVDSGGLLTVGPESAGAEPGPVAYSRGGTRATVTDASVVRGVIRPESFLGGTHPLDTKAAIAALGSLAGKVDRTIEEFASDVTRLVAAHMAGAIRMATTERGHDVADYTLVAYGGAGGLHAAEVAASLGIRQVLIPPYCGMTSAYGLLAAPFRRQFARTEIVDLQDMSDGRLDAAIERLESEAIEQLTREHVNLDGASMRFAFDMRYRGQGFEVAVDIGRRGDIATVQELHERFSDVHTRRYGYANRQRSVQVVTLRLSVDKPLPAVRLPRLNGSRERFELKQHIMENGIQVLAKFTHREGLQVGDRVDGPSVIEDDSSTIVVPTGWTAQVDQHTNLILERSGL